MGKIIRVSMTFPPDLLEEFDETIKGMGYDNRSKALQDAVQEFISEHKWLREKTGQCVGVLTMLYDHKALGLEAALTNTQHHFSQTICSAMHVHLTERDCLETIIIKDRIEKVRKLSEELKTKKGVKLLKLAIVKS